MIVKGKYEYSYSNINLREKVAKRFRKFSKKIAKSHSETLVTIMDFFEWHGFKPNDRFVDSILEEIRKNRKRTEANIAILRDIEVNQTKPNNAMLLSLFGEKIKEEKPIRIEKKFAKKKPKEEKQIEITVPKIRYERLVDKMENITTDFRYVLEKTVKVKNSFGKDYLRLEISKEELERLKRTLKNL